MRYRALIASRTRRAVASGQASLWSSGTSGQRTDLARIGLRARRGPDALERACGDGQAAVRRLQRRHEPGPRTGGPSRGTGGRCRLGESLTPADVVFTYRTVLDAKTNNTSRSELDAVKEVRASGDDKVVFTLKYPYAPFAGRTVVPIVPEHIAGKQDPNTGSFNTKPVGTGPYVLAGWRKGEKLTFKANPPTGAARRR